MPLVALSATAAAVAVVAQRSVGADHLDAPLVGRLGNAATSYVAYGAKLFVPTDLSVYYPARPALSPAAIVASIGLLAGITAVAWRSRRPYLLVGWLWFLGTLVPTIGIVQVGGQSMADRYTYFPSIGLTIAVVWLAADLLRPRAAAASAMAAVIAYTTIAAVQVMYWSGTEPLFAHARAVTTDNDVADEYLARCARRRGDAAAAAGLEAEAGRIHAGLSADRRPR